MLMKTGGSWYRAPVDFVTKLNDSTMLVLEQPIKAQAESLKSAVLNLKVEQASSPRWMHVVNVVSKSCTVKGPVVVFKTFEDNTMNDLAANKFETICLCCSSNLLLSKAGVLPNTVQRPGRRARR